MLMNLENMVKVKDENRITDLYISNLRARSDSSVLYAFLSTFSCELCIFTADGERIDAKYRYYL
jgi:hypothetical protein